MGLSTIFDRGLSMDTSTVVDCRTLRNGLRLYPKLNFIDIDIFENGIGLDWYGVAVRRVSGAEDIGILWCFSSCCDLKQLAHIVLIWVVPVLVIRQCLARDLIQDPMVNIVLIWIEVVHKLEDVLINLHFVPFLLFTNCFNVLPR